MDNVEEIFNLVDIICYSEGGAIAFIKVIVLFFFSIFLVIDKLANWIPVLKSKDKAEVVKNNIHALRYGASEIIAYKKEIIKSLESKIEDLEYKIEEQNKKINFYENSLIKFYHSLYYCCSSLDATQEKIEILLLTSPDSNDVKIPKDVLLIQSSTNQNIKSLLFNIKTEHNFND